MRKFKRLCMLYGGEKLLALERLLNELATDMKK